MPICAHCKAKELKTRENSVPVCIECSIRERLTQEVLETTAQKNKAATELEALTLHVGTVKHLGDVVRLSTASNDLTLARKNMARAYTRLADYLDRGIVPEDLRRSG